MDILCGFISSTTRSFSNELISQLFGDGKLSADGLRLIVDAGGVVPDGMLAVRTLTASCAGNVLYYGLKKEVVLNLCRVEVKSMTIGGPFVFVLHWEQVTFYPESQTLLFNFLACSPMSRFCSLHSYTDCTLCRTLLKHLKNVLF